jgi:hypothetical protein
MNHRKGSALLLVTLLGIAMVAMAAGLISFSMTANKTSYNLDLITICRYSAEAGMEEVKANLKHDDEIESSGYFQSPLYSGPQPAVNKTIGKANVQISYFVVDAPSGRYRAEVLSTVDKMKYRLSMDFSYQVSNTAGPNSLFSKYATFIAQDYVIVGNVYTQGYYHSNNYIKFTDSGARFYEQVTAANHFRDGSNNQYYAPYTMPSPWSNMFQSTETPSHDPAIGTIATPTYAVINTDLYPKAQDPAITPPKFWVDPANPYYASVASTMSKVDISFAHDNAAQVTTATIQIRNSSGTIIRTETQVVDPSKDTLLYSTKQISSIKGTLYGRLAVATSFKPSSTTYSSSYGENIYATPSVTFTDDLILVDQNGNPKNWIYSGAGTGNPVKQKSGKYNFPGIPASTSSTATDSNSSTYHMNNMYATWDNVNIGPKLNPNFNPTFKPSIGIISNGDVLAESSPYNVIMDAAIYVSDPAARIRSSLTYQKGNEQFFGCRITQQNPINASGSYGYTRSRHFTYDVDFVTNPPPFFVAIPGAVSSSVNIAYGSVSGGPVSK